MAKQPWEEKVVDDNDIKYSRRSKGTVISTPLLTALLSVFFVIVVAILFVVFYTSNRGNDKASETSNFYGASSSITSSSKDSSETTSDSSTDASSNSTTDSSSSAGNRNTITVLSGEGAASIAARAGISVETLYELNPDHMTLGYWYANPGDEVYTN